MKSSDPIRASSKGKKKSIEQYDHVDKSRRNNPPVGLVTPDNDHDGGSKMYEYDPHLDPTLQWAGKAEHTFFEVPTVSWHVHERIDPRTIIEAVEKDDPAAEQQPAPQLGGHPWRRKLMKIALAIMGRRTTKETTASDRLCSYIAVGRERGKFCLLAPYGEWVEACSTSGEGT